MSYTSTAEHLQVNLDEILLTGQSRFYFKWLWILFQDQEVIQLNMDCSVV